MYSFWSAFHLVKYLKNDPSYKKKKKTGRKSQVKDFEELKFLQTILCFKDPQE